MPRKVSISEYNRLVQQQNRAIKQQEDRYNRAVKQDIDAYNRDVNRVNAHNKRVIDDYNRQVRNYNAKERQRSLDYERAVQQMNSMSFRTVVYSTTEIRRSSQVLIRSYEGLGRDIIDADNVNENRELLTLWPERETTNSVELYNALNGFYNKDISSDLLTKSDLEISLSRVSPDLCARWKGALYSLNHNNPDASRHFCTSIREILTSIIEIKAPDNYVSTYYTNCEYGPNGKPTRRSKIKYLVQSKSILLSSYEKFVNDDVQDVVNLFEVLNSGTHGNAGKLDVGQLIQLKKRVEDSIQFILKF